MTSKFWEVNDQVLAKETDLSQFKRWTHLLDIPLYSYMEGLNHYVNDNRKLLLPRKDKEVWLQALREPPTGHSERTYQLAMRKFRGYPCTSWTLKTINPLLHFEEQSSKSILDFEQIVDFGAGIGETTRIIHDLGFTGKMWICDLPGISRISQFYLQGRPVSWVEDAREIPNTPKTLFIATWSLSEVPLEDRGKIVKHFRKHDFLIATQNRFYETDFSINSQRRRLLSDQGYDNIGYFNHDFPKHSGVKCSYVYGIDFPVGKDNASFYVCGVGNK